MSNESAAPKLLDKVLKRIQGLRTSSPEPPSKSSHWQHRILRLNPLLPEALYGYKERKTPDRFNPDPNKTAFRIEYGSDSSPSQLQPLYDGNLSDGSAKSIDFKDTNRHFKNNPIPKIRGWRLTDNDGSKDAWEACKKSMQDEGQYGLNMYDARDKSKSHIRSRAFVSGPDSLWALRGFFIGPDTRCSPPYVTVLCSKENESKCLVDSIDKALRGKGLQDWGVTRLPDVQIRDYGSRSGSPENVDYGESTSELDEMEVQIIDGEVPSTIPNDATFSSWTNHRHRCGVKFQVTSDSNVIASGTIGGLVKVGDRLYGLTVAHVFHRKDQRQKSYATSSSLGESAQNQWKDLRKESMLLDWSLVELPGLENSGDDPDTWDDVNLVRTMNGDFRPVLTAMEMPCSGAYAVLATPGSTHCLRGILTGEEANVHMPGSPALYTTWVLQVEQPWLIQAGDSGSWAFDAITGDLLGVLVAGCPELQEAYIIPAYHILDHIEKNLGQDVRLPNCHRVQKQDQDNLTYLERDFLAIRRDIPKVNSAAEMKNVQSLADHWIQKSRTIPNNEPKTSFQPRNKASYWDNRYRDRIHEHTGTLISKESIPRGTDLMALHARSTIRPYQDALRLPVLESYNSLSKMFRNLRGIKREHRLEASEIMPGLLWGHLVLGEQKFGPFIGTNSRAAYDIRQVLYEELQAIDGSNYHSQKGFKFPRDRYCFREVVDMLRQNLEDSVANWKRWYSVSLPETLSFDPGLSGNITLYIVVLLSKDEDRVLVLAPPAKYTAEGDRIRNVRLPYVQMDKEKDEKGNFNMLLKDLLGLEEATPYQCRRVELSDPSIWLEEHKQYVDLVAFKAMLSQKDLERARTGSSEMPVAVVDTNYGRFNMISRPFESILRDAGN